MNAESREATAGSAQRRMRRFWFYRLTDGSLCGGQGCTDHPGFEERVRRDAAASGQGVIEHDGELDLRHDRVDVTTGKLIDTVDHAFAADLDAKWQSILGLFPVLASPVPPAPMPKSPGGRQSFSVSAFWGDFAKRAAAGEWPLRAPESGTELVGPFVSRGICLEPVRTAGDVSWYDVATPAQDGDMVLLRWDWLELQRIYERMRDKPEWLAVYPVPNPLAVKVLKAFGGTYWLCCNETMLPLGKNTILGVLRHCMRNGKPLYENATPAPCIVPGAATQPYSAADDGPDSFDPAATGDAYLSISGAKIDAASLLQGSLTFDASIVDPVSTLANVTLRVDWSGGSQSSPAVQPQHTDARGYAIQLAFDDLPANTAWTMKVGLSGNADITLRRVNMRAEAIIR